MLKGLLSATLLILGLVVAGASTAPTTAPTPPVTRPVAFPTTLPVKWVSMPIRSPRQAQLGMPGGEGGQCVHGIVRSAADDNRIYVAVDVVGVWRSRNGGASWLPCGMRGFGSIGTSSIAVSPTHPDELLVFADTPDWDKPRLQEEGLYRSTDAGETWTRVITTPNPDLRRGWRHLIDYAPDGKRAYFISHQQGFYRSDDSGAIWTGPTALKGVLGWEVKVDPTNRDTVYCATDEGLQVSTDAGATFKLLEGFGNGSAIAVSLDPVTAGRIYAVKDGAGLLRSDDGGKTFEPMHTGNKEVDTQAKSFFQSPADPKRLLLADFNRAMVSSDGASWKQSVLDTRNSFVQQTPWGFSEGYSWSCKDPQRVVTAISCAIYASDDGGQTFFDSGSGYTGFHHGWCNSSIAFTPNPNVFAFFCYDYAFLMTADGGRAFGEGRLKQKVRGWWGMYTGDLNPDWSHHPQVIAAAGNYWTQALVRSENGGVDWITIPGTDGVYFFVRYHPRNPNIIYAGSLRSDNGGKSFHALAHEIIAMAPSNPDVVYGYGGGKVWCSVDRGDHWRALPDAPSHAGDSSSARRSIEVDPTNPAKIWAMTPPDCAMFDGKSWHSVKASTWVPASGHPYVDRFAIDPANGQRVVIGLDTIGTSCLFLSDDGGATWSDITGNLPCLGSSQSVAIQPKTGKIFMGCGFGTWTSIIPRTK